MGQFETGGAFPAFLQPTQNKNLYNGNYINFTDGSVNQWAQQFMPDLYKQIAPIYGNNQSIAGFLKMVTNGEMSSNSDQIIWQEEGRLHTRYTGLFGVADTAQPTDGNPGALVTASVALAANGRFARFSLNATPNQSGPGSNNTLNPSLVPYDTGGATVGAQGATSINFRVGQTVMIQAENTTNEVLKGVITATNATTFSVAWYEPSKVATGSAGTGTYTALVYGSEFAKGTGNFTEKVDSEYTTYQNSPIIMKDHYAINGSDLSQVGWIDTGEGYLWYHKSKSDNMKRWNDYMEMSLVEGVSAETGTNASTGRLQNYLGDYRTDTTSGFTRTQGQLQRGTQGFFSALEERGQVYQGFGDEAAGGGALTDFDNLLKQLDKQGSIEENMLYLNRDLSLEIDDILSQQNSYGAGGTSWGAFDNDEKMALDLGFSGFRRGSYDFYKTDWRYLNDFATRGGFSDIDGVLIPAGTSTVYDKIAGNKVKRPFLHVRYREGRKMKNWITGGAGGATTSDIDEIRMHYLTERCLITQGANNFVLFKS